MRKPWKLTIALVLLAALGSQARACNPVAVVAPQFGFAGASFTPFGVALPGFGFNSFGLNAFGFNNFAVATPFGFGGVNVAVANVGGARVRNAVVVRGGRGAVVRTRTVIRR